METTGSAEAKGQGVCVSGGRRELGGEGKGGGCGQRVLRPRSVCSWRRVLGSAFLARVPRPRSSPAFLYTRPLRSLAPASSPLPLSHSFPLYQWSTHLQNIQADLSIVVNIRMKDFRNEPNLRSFVGVILAELKNELERSPFPRGFVRAEDDGLPEHDVAVGGGAGYAGGGVVLEATEVAEEAAAGGG